MIASIVLLPAVSAYARGAGTPIASTIYAGNIYALVSYPAASWNEANSDAMALGGHLASLTTQQETMSVYNAFYGTGFFSSGSPAQQAWIGGYTTDPNYSTRSSTAWAWTDGEPWTAFDAGNFGPGEPTGDSTGLTINRFQSPAWNDEGWAPATVGGYIVKFSRATTPSVPEPSVYAGFAGVGLLAYGALRRRD